MKMTKNSVESTKILLIIATLLFGLGAAFAQTNVLFPLVGSVWKYNQTNDLYTETAGGVGWTLYDYDDSGPSWQEGPGVFAWEPDAWDDPITRTVINSPRTANPLYGGVNHHARYFRKKFTYDGPAPAPHTALRLNRRFDDGAIIWLNGIEIGRVNWSTFNPPTFTLRSECFSCAVVGQCTEGGGDANCEQITLLPADQLLVGDNIIAVSVHQTGDNSSDLVFGTSLEVVLPKAPTIVSNSEPADRFVLEFRSTTLQVYADAFPAPSYQWYFSTSDSGPFDVIIDATNSSYTIASMTLATEGYYYCHVENVLGSVDSRKAHVQFTDDPDPPVIVSAISLNFTNVTVQFNEAMDRPSTIDLYPWTVMDDVNPPYEIVGVALSADGTVATLSLRSDLSLPQDTVITVIAQGVADVSGNTQDDTRTTFRTFTTAGCRSFLFEAFDTASAPGNAVSLLTNHANYPYNPRETYALPSFDTRHVYPLNTPDPVGRPDETQREQFGGRVRGLFIPNTTGPWVFYLAADDDAQLFVNPSGPDATGKLKVAAQDGIGCCLNFQAQGNPRTSAPMNLTAGQAYYVEALYKEGGGGDWLKVAARRASEPVPAGGNSEAGSVSPGVIQGGAGPAGILNHVTIASHPAIQAVRAGQRATFTVRLTPDVPGCFQWKRNGEDIAGAVGPSYWLSTTLADDQARFSVAISLMGGTTLMSDEATLTVTNDTIAPTVISVSQNLVGNLTVTYDEPVDMNTATNPANYAIDGVAPALVTASGSSAVRLVPSTPVAQCPVAHTVAVSNVKDLFNNTIEATSVPLTINNLLVLPINAAQSWRYNDAGTDLGDGWYATAYNDADWSNGVPSFSFPAGEGLPAEFPVRTVLAGVRPTTYFRTHFNLSSDPSTVTNLQLNVVLDDGAAFFLNGQEFTLVRMASFTPAFDALSTGGQPGGDPPQILETYNNLPTGALRTGDNVLAVRVHQSSTGSSDTVMTAALVAQVSACGAPRPRLSISLNGNQATITSTPPGGTIYRSATVDGTPTPVGPAPQTVTIGPGQEFFSIRP
jgi:hypothetical protein